MKMFSKGITILILVLIAVNIFLSSWWLLKEDIHYDVDVSRDFLVMDDIVRNHHFTLLGPRSGAIPGVFHGPLWFYVNLPAFLIGGGDPLVVGWFWFILSLTFLLIVFFIAKKLFNLNVAILSVLLLSANSIINPSIGLRNFYNPYGAVFLTPLFFWWFYQYINSLRIKYLVLSLFILGLMIQFQMAFGVPILIAVTAFLLFFLLQKRKLYHLLCYGIIIIPLSTFILFDLKHEGLQFKSIIQYLSYKNGVPFNFVGNLLIRIKELIFDCFEMLFPGKNLFTLFYSIIFIFGFTKSFLKSDKPQKKIYGLFCLIFVGFWVISLLYHGGLGNYSWPFLPLIVIIFCSLYNSLNKKIFLVFFTGLFLVNMYIGISAVLNFNLDVNKRGPHSWAFNLQLAKNVYSDAHQDFGYFTFSPDRYAYQQRYAFVFAKKFYHKINSYSSTKKPLTYLIEVDPAPDRQDINSINWRISDIKLERKPDQTFRWDFIQVEKYFLKSDEIKIKPNPYLLDNVFLR